MTSMKSGLRTHKFLLSGILFVAILTFAFFNTSTRVIKSRSFTPESGKRIVLYWTTIWGRDASYLLGGRDVHKCTPQCAITSDRSLQSFADAVVMHSSDISLLDLPEEQDHQKWIYYNSESPENTPFTANLFLRLMNDKIDAVMSYRSDSQFVIPYGRVIERKDQYVWKPIPLKPKKVAWFVSNCETSSRREDLVRHLSQFIHVDVFGGCGDMSCPRGNDSCNLMLEQNYSFYLALENSLCKDYVTEKLYRTLKYNLIPIVLGPPENYSHLPKGSFIDATKFKSLPLLAELLNLIASNETLYNSYLEWKSKYEVQLLEYEEQLCAPCRRNDTEELAKTDSWSKWWFRDAKCFRWKNQL